MLIESGYLGRRVLVFSNRTPNDIEDRLLKLMFHAFTNQEPDAYPYVEMITTNRLTVVGPGPEMYKLDEVMREADAPLNKTDSTSIPPEHDYAPIPLGRVP